MLTLAIMAVLTMDTKYFLVMMESIHLQNAFEDQLFNFAPKKKRNKRRWLVLHVGPGKTGTTSIQATLGKNWSEAVFRSDHYKYIGNNGGILKRTLSYNCDNNNTVGCNHALSSELVDLLEKEDRNLVGSNEFLGSLNDEKRQAWVDATRDKKNVTRNKWNMTVVVSYRRLHELLLSSYNQHFKKNRINSERRSYGHHNWPGVQGNYKIPTFSEYLANEVDLNEHDSVRTYEAWGKDFPVSIFNIHQEGDLTTNFVCQAIPDADRMCQRLTNEGPKETKGNDNRSTRFLDYDILAVTAYEKGLVHEFDKRYELSRAIQLQHKKLKRSKRDLPQACPNKDSLDQLYKASLKFETWALAFGVSKPVTDFNASWNTILEKEKLCSVNATAALEQDIWREFFRLRYSRKSMESFYSP